LTAENRGELWRTIGALPPLATVSVEVNASDAGLTLSLKSTGGTYVESRFSSLRTLSGYLRMPKRGTRTSIHMRPPEDVRQKGWVRLVVRIDRRRELAVRVSVDGPTGEHVLAETRSDVLVGEAWRGEENESWQLLLNGYSMRRNRTPVKIRRIRIEDASTSTDLETPAHAAGHLKANVVVLEGGDRIVGRARAIAESRIHLESAYGPVSIDMGTVRDVVMRLSHAPSARRSRADVRVLFGRAGRLTLSTPVLEGASITGTHSELGTVSLPLDECRRIDFLERPADGAGVHARDGGP
jgi:hypothetical protein